MTFPVPIVCPSIKYDAPGSVTYTTAGAQNFTVPRYRNALTIEIWGGAGGGGTQGYNGANGGNSSVSALGLLAGGGGGGLNTASNGAGGIASGGDVNTNGAAGSGSSGGAGANAGIANGGAGGAYNVVTNNGWREAYNEWWWSARSPDIFRIYWNGSLVVNTTYSAVGPISSYTTGGYTYTRYSGNSDGTRFAISRYYTAYGRGGGGGAYVKKTFSRGELSAKTILALIVGAGGAGGNTGAAGGGGRIKITWT
ncbi:UNVERIFIED_ORG: hypothetical protein J2W19_002684 [Shinella zoogloeoides]|nr:hypothetical protein [Shinella zoogloeoides]